MTEEIKNQIKIMNRETLEILAIGWLESLERAQDLLQASLGVASDDEMETWLNNVKDYLWS